MRKKGRKKKYKERKISFKFNIIPYLLLSLFIFPVFWYLIYPFVVPQFNSPVLFTNDPTIPGNKYYNVGDIYLSLINKARSLSPGGIVDGVVFHGKRDKKVVALTFDADMTPQMKQSHDNKYAQYYDDKLISLLNKTKTKATLFLAGMWIETYPEAARELAQNPLFELGSHSYSHPSFNGYCYGLTQIAENEKVGDIGFSQKLLSNITDKPTTLFRFPGGCYGKSDVLLVQRAGETVIQWDVVANDGFNTNITTIVNNVLSNTKNGSIIVMHMNGFPNDPVTSQAVSIIIPALKSAGFTFVTVSELLNPPEIYPTGLKFIYD